MDSGTGTCTVHYNQAGNANYSAAPEVTSDTTAALAAQTITVTTAVPASAVFEATSCVVATASSGLDVAITTSGVCSVQSGGTGSAVIHMDSGRSEERRVGKQWGNANYPSAPEVTSDTTAALAAQQIQVTTTHPPSAAYDKNLS